MNLRTAKSPKKTPSGAESPASLGLAREEGAIVCATCDGIVTTASARVSINGAHEHLFKNPEGIDFRIGCFREAPGCAPISQISSVWTWFPGMTWQAEVCTACGEHLGWIYRVPASLEPAFHGLILDRLVEIGPS
jgi:hypothetical protein